MTEQTKQGKAQKPKKTDPQIPQPDLRFASQKTAKQQENGARAQQKQPHKNCHETQGESSLYALAKPMHRN